MVLSDQFTITKPHVRSEAIRAKCSQVRPQPWRVLLNAAVVTWLGPASTRSTGPDRSTLGDFKTSLLARAGTVPRDEGSFASPVVTGQQSRMLPSRSYERSSLVPAGERARLYSLYDRAKWPRRKVSLIRARHCPELRLGMVHEGRPSARLAGRTSCEPETKRVAPFSSRKESIIK